MTTSPKRQNRAVVSINGEFLKRALGLPENCTIEGARGNDASVEFKVRHKDLPETAEGEPIPVLVPLIEFTAGCWPNLLNWHADHPIGAVLAGPGPLRVVA